MRHIHAIIILYEKSDNWLFSNVSAYVWLWQHKQDSVLEGIWYSQDSLLQCRGVRKIHGQQHPDDCRHDERS